MNRNKEFRVNDYITLKLEEDETNIYVNGEEFKKCKYLLMNTHLGEVGEYEMINSVDELSETLNHELEGGTGVIDSNLEFWGHCSNLEAWVENDYDTRILGRRIAFPLLKKLSESGDNRAKRVFKEEVAERVSKGCKSVFLYLVEEDYLKYFNDDEFRVVYDNFVKNSPHEEFNNYLLFLRDLSEQGSSNLTSLINEYEGLKRLNLKEMELERVPESVKNLNSLETLILETNYLKELPPGISELENLKKLNVNYNVLESIPREIRALRNLEELYLVKSVYLKELPSSIGGLDGLKRLILDYNGLEKLPYEVGDLRRLEVLSLNKSVFLKDLPVSIKSLKNLRELNLRRNANLTGFQEGVTELESLKRLCVMDNNIVEVPESISELKRLEWLDLGTNALRDLPESIGELQNLQYLNVKNNILRTLPDSITNLESLKELNVRYNKIRDDEVEDLIHDLPDGCRILY